MWMCSCGPCPLEIISTSNLVDGQNFYYSKIAVSLILHLRHNPIFNVAMTMQ